MSPFTNFFAFTNNMWPFSGRSTEPIADDTMAQAQPTQQMEMGQPKALQPMGMACPTYFWNWKHSLYWLLNDDRFSAAAHRYTGQHARRRPRRRVPWSVLHVYTMPVCLRFLCLLSFRPFARNLPSSYWARVEIYMVSLFLNTVMCYISESSYLLDFSVGATCLTSSSYQVFRRIYLYFRF